ncbi:unnamed protein product, partial [Mesorhabditis belari]|uniref:Uncharacterized protein n=1 Tax=Mesorhabditis belari TaxID=2138241 RepID=A0AAF3EW19_9BILA
MTECRIFYKYTERDDDRATFSLITSRPQKFVANFLQELVDDFTRLLYGTVKELKEENTDKQWFLIEFDAFSNDTIAFYKKVHKASPTFGDFLGTPNIEHCNAREFIVSSKGMAENERIFIDSIREKENCLIACESEINKEILLKDVPLWRRCEELSRNGENGGYFLLHLRYTDKDKDQIFKLHKESFVTLGQGLILGQLSPSISVRADVDPGNCHIFIDNQQTNAFEQKEMHQGMPNFDKDTQLRFIEKSVETLLSKFPYHSPSFTYRYHCKASRVLQKTAHALKISKNDLFNIPLYQMTLKNGRKYWGPNREFFMDDQNIFVPQQRNISFSPKDSRGKDIEAIREMLSKMNTNRPENEEHERNEHLMNNQCNWPQLGEPQRMNERRRGNKLPIAIPVAHSLPIIIIIIIISHVFPTK